jgi:hypothetical protein
MTDAIPSRAAEIIAQALRAEVDEYGLGTGAFDLQIARAILRALEAEGFIVTNPSGRFEDTA